MILASVYVGFLLAFGVICLMMQRLGAGIFNMIWAVVIFICRDQLFQENFAQTLFLLTIMIVMVNVGAFIGGANVRFSFTFKKTTEDRVEFYPKAITLLLIIATIIFMYYAILTFVKFGLNLELIRGSNNSDSSERVFSSVFDTIMFYGIGMPIVYVGSLVCAYNFSQGVHTPKNIYWLLAVSSILYVVTAGGRSLFLRVALFFAAAMLWRLKTARGITLKWLKYLMFGIAALLIIMEIVTSARNSTNISFFDQALAYIRGSVSHMQYQLELMPNDDYYYGYITYGGFFYYPAKLLSEFFGERILTSNEIMAFLQAYKYIQVGERITYFNALVPNAFYYYYDSGYIGVVVFSAVLGFSLSRSELAHKWPSFGKFVIWATAIYAIVYAPMDAVLWTFRYPTALIYCFALRNVIYRRIGEC